MTLKINTNSSRLWRGEELADANLKFRSRSMSIIVEGDLKIRLMAL